MEKRIPYKWKSKKAGVAILISYKIGFKIKTITRDKEGHYIIIKGSIQEEGITIVNIYAPNIGAPQYIRQMLTAIKGEIDSNKIIVGDFNTRLSPMDRSSKMKINKETKALTDILNKMDLIDLYRTFHIWTCPYVDIPYSVVPNNNRIHFLLKCSWNILQDRSYLGSQIKPW